MSAVTHNRTVTHTFSAVTPGGVHVEGELLDNGIKLLIGSHSKFLSINEAAAIRDVLDQAVAYYELERRAPATSTISLNG